MAALRHMALGCCVVSTVAGMIRTFWPENSFKPVINAVLVLYIVSMGVQLLHTADWNGVGTVLGGLAQQQVQAVPDYSAYRQELADTAGADAVREVLANSGIEASVSLQDGVCMVTLVYPRDYAAAEALLEANCGSLPYTLDGGDTP